MYPRYQNAWLVIADGIESLSTLQQHRRSYDGPPGPRHRSRFYRDLSGLTVRVGTDIMVSILVGTLIPCGFELPFADMIFCGNSMANPWLVHPSHSLLRVKGQVRASAKMLWSVCITHEKDLLCIDSPSCSSSAVHSEIC